MTLIDKTELSSVLKFFSRNGGIGLCSSVARIGGICAPLIALLAMFGDAIPYIIFGALGLFGAFLTMFLPEVLDRKLPDTVEEVSWPRV